MTAAQVHGGWKRHTDGWLVQVEPSGTGRADGWTPHLPPGWSTPPGAAGPDLVAALAGCGYRSPAGGDRPCLKGNYFKLAPPACRGGFRHLV